MNRNILNRFCFTLGLSILMAAAGWAAGPEDVPAHMTSVVRSDARTGKLVRGVVVSSRVVNERTVSPAVISPRAISTTAPASLPEVPIPTGVNEVVASVAARQELPPQLIHAIIKTESNYNTHAISSKGAFGLMQLMPPTARRFGVSHVFDPVENIEGGARYLKYLLTLYNNDYPLALAAYNAGEAAVAKYNGIPPYPETQNYVVQVRNYLQKLMAAEEAKHPSVAQASPAAPSGPTHVQEVVDPDGTVRYVSR